MRYLTKGPIHPESWHRDSYDMRDGASVEFLGVVRGKENGRNISFLEYEAYVPMAEKVIAKLVEEAKKMWPLHKLYLRHRIGCIGVGEISVIIGVQAPHRKEAFGACQYLIDHIKKDVPIWKKEYGGRTGLARGLSKRKTLAKT